MDLKDWVDERLVEPEDIAVNDLADMDTEWDPKAPDGPFVRIIGTEDVIKLGRRYFGTVRLKRTAKVLRKYGHFILCIELNRKQADRLYGAVRQG